LADLDRQASLDRLRTQLAAAQESVKHWKKFGEDAIGEKKALQAALYTESAATKVQEDRAVAAEGKVEKLTKDLKTSEDEIKTLKEQNLKLEADLKHSQATQAQMAADAMVIMRRQGGGN